ncbi:hypothetical protein, partial [Sandarakinorhabdus rubra]|uniref:hypothetical protein n=1 Tax=Sandarakinorhabdus rubra TaxID=2672568 RepID=UPI0013D9AA56
MSDCRILALGGEWPQRGPGWQLLPFEGDPLAVAADVALLPADSALAPALLDRLALPLIVAVADG